MVQAPRPNASCRENLRGNYLLFWGGGKLPKKKIFFGTYLLVMPKYWGKQIFTHGRFPEVGQKQKTERKRREKREKEKD